MIHEIDCLGDMCPLPVLKADRLLKTCSAGDAVVLATDHGCVLTSLADKFTTPVYDVSVEEVITGVWEVTIEKKR